MISLVIPVYNVSSLVNSLFDNLLQSNPHFYEILLIDDGSSDDTFAQLSNKIIENEIKHIKIFTKLNGGVSSARNFGLKMISQKSRFLCFYDSDDKINFNALNELCSSIEKEESPKDFVLFNFERLEVSKSIKIMHNLPESFDIKKVFIQLYTKGLLQPCWNKVFRTELIVKNNLFFDESISMGEDFRFNLQYLKLCNNFHASDLFVYKYNVFTTGSLSNKFNPNSFELFKQGVEQVRSFCQSKEIQYPEINNRYLYALRDRLLNLNRSKLPIGICITLFKEDFEFASKLDSIAINKVSDKKDKMVAFFLKINCPSMLLILFFTLFKIKRVVSNFRFKMSRLHGGFF